VAVPRYSTLHIRYRAEGHTCRYSHTVERWQWQCKSVCRATRKSSKGVVTAFGRLNPPTRHSPRSERARTTLCSCSTPDAQEASRRRRKTCRQTQPLLEKQIEEQVQDEEPVPSMTAADNCKQHAIKTDLKSSQERRHAVQITSMLARSGMLMQYVLTKGIILKLL